MGESVDVLAFGEVLWDVIEGVQHIGGAPFNFAAHAVKCGCSATLVSAVGNDDLGNRAREAIARQGVDGYLVRVHPTLPTGTVNVTLKDGIPSYEIVRPVAWDEIAIGERDTLPTPRAFYFGTLAQRSDVSARTLEMLIDRFPDALVFFDVNLRQSYWSAEQVEKGIGRSNVLKVNDEEMARLNLNPKGLFERHPRLEVVIETRGANGCAVWSRTGESIFSPAVPDGPVVDTVGAGDSFSAAFLSALLGGKTLEEAAIAGNVRAGRVAARAGAIPEGV